MSEVRHAWCMGCVRSCPKGLLGFGEEVLSSCSTAGRGGGLLCPNARHHDRVAPSLQATGSRPADSLVVMRVCHHGSIHSSAKAVRVALPGAAVSNALRRDGPQSTSTDAGRCSGMLCKAGHAGHASLLLWSACSVCDHRP